MSVITFLSFRSTIVIIQLSYLTGKRHSHQFDYFLLKIVFFIIYYIAVIYDKKFLTRIRRSM